MRPFVLLLLLLFAGVVHAQETIHHCVDANGNPVFTDTPCAAMHAVPVTAAPAAATSVVAAPRLVLAHCAATVDALKRRVVDAFAAHAPNRLAGLMLWQGYGDRAAVADIRELGELMRQPLLGVRVVTGSDGPPAPAASAAGTAGPPGLELSTAAGDGSGQPERSYFQVVPQAGCLWLEAAG